MALKGLGVGIFVGAIKLFYDAISKNQRVMDALSTALGTIGILFEKAFNVILDTVDAVSEASKGFEGLKNVMSGLLTLVLTPFKLAFYEISREIQLAQLIWEKSFFGGGDKDKIKELTESIEETAKKMMETSANAREAGGQVLDNLGKAASEIGQVVGGAVDGIQKISVKGAYEQAKAIKEADKAAQIAVANQASLVEKYDRLAEKQRQIRDEERNSIEDRKKANDELGSILDEQEKAMLAQADAQIRLAELNKAANKNDENEIALIEAKANKLAVLAQIEGFRSEQKANDLALDREKMEMLKAISDSEASLSFERKKFNAEQIEDKLLSLETLRALEEENQQEEMLRLEGIVEKAQAGTQAEVDALIALDEFREASRQRNVEADNAIADEKSKRLLDEQKKKFEALKAESEIEEENFKARREELARREALLLEDDKLSKEQRLKLEKQFADERVKITQDEEALRAKILQQRLQMASDILGAINGLAQSFAKKDEESQRKAFNLNKAFAAGQVILSTAVGVANALTAGGNPIKLASGAQFVEAGIVAATGAAQFTAIQRSQFGGSSSSPTAPTNTTFGGGDVGTQPRGFTPNIVQPDAPTTKVIVTETDIRKATTDISGIYNKAIVVE